MALPCTIQSQLPSPNDSVGAAVVHGGWRQPVQTRMVVDVVVLVEEIPAERLGVLERTETFREVGPVFERLELRFRERVVIGHIRPGVGFGHSQVREQQRHHLRLHRRPAIGVEDQLIPVDPLLEAAFTNQLF